MSLKQKNRKFKTRIKLNHNRYTAVPIILYPLTHCSKYKSSENKYKVRCMLTDDSQ